jgi:hypothetical protein
MLIFSCRQWRVVYSPRFFSENRTWPGNCGNGPLPSTIDPLISAKLLQAGPRKAYMFNITLRSTVVFMLGSSALD